MNYNLLGVAAFLTILAWLFVLFVIYLMWGPRKKPASNPLIGHVESITKDARGIGVEFRIHDSAVDSDGVRHIRNATIHGISIVDQTAPGWQGRITHVDGKARDE